MNKHLSSERDNNQVAVLESRNLQLNVCLTLWSGLWSLQTSVLHQFKGEGHVVDLQKESGEAVRAQQSTTVYYCLCTHARMHAHTNTT